MLFQPGEGPIRGFLRDYEPSDGPSFQALGVCHLMIWHLAARLMRSEVKLLQDKVTHCGQLGGDINIYDTHPSSFSRNDGYIKIKSDLFAGCKICCSVVSCFETVHQEWFELGVSSAQLGDDSLHFKIIKITFSPLETWRLEALISGPC